MGMINTKFGRQLPRYFPLRREGNRWMKGEGHGSLKPYPELFLFFLEQLSEANMAKD